MDAMVTTVPWTYQGGRELVAREDVENLLAAAALLVTQALQDVEAIQDAKSVERADLHIRNVYKCPEDMRRPFTLKDAKPRARCAARLLRQAWDVLEPTLTPNTTLSE
jgi:hypothetical protein